MMVWPDAPPSWEYIDRLPRAEYRQAAFDVFDHLDALTPESVGAETDGHDQRFPFLRFDAAASERFRDWLSALMLRLRSEELHPALESHFSKYRSLIPSLALLHHLMNGGRGPVGLLSVVSAIAWGEYLEGHANRIYGSAVNDTAQAARAILRHIRAGDLVDGFTRRDIERKGWAGLQSNGERIQAGLSMLIDYGWLREVAGHGSSERGGRPGLPTYIINPRGRV
jgi:putative DNA primase/helicase